MVLLSHMNDKGILLESEEEHHVYNIGLGNDHITMSLLQSIIDVLMSNEDMTSLQDLRWLAV